MKQTLFSTLVMVCAILLGYWWLAPVSILVVDIFACYMLHKRKTWSETFQMMTPSFIYQIVGVALGVALTQLAASFRA